MLRDLCEGELFVQHLRCFDKKRYAPIAKSCGCFYCLRHFDVSEITHWYESEKEKTATCPYCQIDSVIIETEHEHVEHDLLCQLNMRFFNTAPVERGGEVSYAMNLYEILRKIYRDHKTYGRGKSRYCRNEPARKCSRLLKTLILRV